MNTESFEDIEKLSQQKCFADGRRIFRAPKPGEFDPAKSWVQSYPDFDGEWPDWPGFEKAANMADTFNPLAQQLATWIYENGHCDALTLYWHLNRDLQAAGRAQWPPEYFYGALWFGVRWAAKRKEDDLKRAAEDRRARDPKDGKRSPKASGVELIMRTLAVQKSRAYLIWTNGTTDHGDRLALAEAFGDDPTRSMPAAWEPKGRKTRGRPPKYSFREYVESGADLFEADLNAALAALGEAYGEGVLPDHFKAIEELAAAAKRAEVPIQAADLFGVWAGFKSWRDADAA